MRNWTTPTLVCLSRGRPEEAVLIACKTIQVGPPPAADPTSGYNQCCFTAVPGPGCDCCYTQSLNS